jgi:hypothetical protein
MPRRSVWITPLRRHAPLVQRSREFQLILFSRVERSVRLDARASRHEWPVAWHFSENASCRQTGETCSIA